MKQKTNSPAIYEYRYTLDTIQEASKLTPGTIAHQAHFMGMTQGEPLIIMMDCLLQYALTYKARYEGNLSTDQVLGPLWLQSAKGIRGLLNGDGAVAMQRNITTDSKDNGCVESVFWKAIEAAGYTDKDV